MHFTCQHIQLQACSPQIFVLALGRASTRIINFGSDAYPAHSSSQVCPTDQSWHSMWDELSQIYLLQIQSLFWKTQLSKAEKPFQKREQTNLTVKILLSSDAFVSPVLKRQKVCLNLARKQVTLEFFSCFIRTLQLGKQTLLQFAAQSS